jgi:hypothetical protein
MLYINCCQFNFKKIISSLSISLFLTTVSCCATDIQQIDSLKQISTKKFVKNTLVLLDLDENIILDKIHVQPRYQHLIAPNAAYRLIEDDIAKTVLNLKTSVSGNSANVVILGLTKRGAKKNKRFDQGHKHVEQENIPFSRSKFKHLNGTTLCGNSNACFYNGIIYTAGQNKGTYLEDFLIKSKFNPAHMVTSDDKEQNLRDVISFAKKKNIPIEAYQMNGVKKL